MPDVVLTADGSDVTLKRGVGSKSHQYWEIHVTNNGVRIMQCKHDNHFVGVNNHRIVIKK